jgi:hypothetical protein
VETQRDVLIKTPLPHPIFQPSLQDAFHSDSDANWCNHDEVRVYPFPIRWPIMILLCITSVSAYHMLVLNGGVFGVSGFAHRTTSWLGFKAHKSLSPRISKEDSLTAVENPDPDHLALLSLAGLVAGGAALGLFRQSLERQLQAQTVDMYSIPPISGVQIAGLALAGLLVGLGSKVGAFRSGFSTRADSLLNIVVQRVYVRSHALRRVQACSPLASCHHNLLPSWSVDSLVARRAHAFLL